MYLYIIYVFSLHNEIRSITKTVILRVVKETSKYPFYIIFITNRNFRGMSDKQISLGKM